MLLYINNQMLKDEETFGCFYNSHKSDGKPWLRSSLLVGMGPFIDPYLTNSNGVEFDKTTSYKTTIGNIITEKYSSIINLRLKNMFLLDNNDKLVIKPLKDISFDINDKTIKNSYDCKIKMIRIDKTGYPMIDNFYKKENYDNIQIFDFVNIEIPNIKTSLIAPEIYLKKFIVSIQFIYDKETGELFTYLYNINGEYNKPLDSEITEDWYDLYKRLISVLDRLEISFDFKVE